MAGVSTKTRRWEPNWAVHPGALLQEHLEVHRLSPAQFASLACLPFALIIVETSPVTPEVAIALERVLGVKAYIWIGIQANWDRFTASRSPMDNPEGHVR